MMTTPDQHPPIGHPAQETELTAGQILRARIKKMYLDKCDLDLLDSDGGIIAQGRLYQAESLVWKDTRLLKDIPEYGQSKLLDAVYLRRLRHEESQALWYVHERWGKNNPWEDLKLREGYILTGTVARSVVSTRSGEQVGYLVQLDVDARVRVSESGIIGLSDCPQPDIEVFLPNRELPWADGSLDEMPPNHRTERMPLAIGDPIQAVVREIRMPPNDPVVSVVHLIHHRDANAEKAFRHRGNLANWRFQRFLGKTSPTATLEGPPSEFTPGDRPYTDRRFLLVDDDSDTLVTLSERLSLMGAEVHAVNVRPDHFPEAVNEVLTVFKDSNFDLALIDNNLPGKDLGQSLIRRVSARLGNKEPARFVLITADDVRIPEGDIRVKLRASGTVGFVRRPLRHAFLQRILVDEEEVWEDTGAHANAVQSTGYLPSTRASMTPREMLETIAQQEGIHFALLIRASRQIEAQDLLAAGHVPFEWYRFSEVVARTDLRLLIDQRMENEQLDILTQEGGNESLCFGRDGRSHWRILDFGGTRWIFGIGYAPDVDVPAQLSIWSAALGTAVDAQGWREWGRHVSSFVQSGLAHHSLSHEVIHLESDFDNLLFALEDRIERLQLGAALKNKEKEYLAGKIVALRRKNDELLAFSKHQLYRQVLRHRDVFLPDVVTAIKLIIASECKKAQVALHIMDPPPLALPLANAALVLPVINLLLNAAKHHYRQENRRAELVFDLEEKGDEPFLLIYVRDNGPGLARTALEQLWQPGFSAAPDRDQRHGIGLWLSRQLVEEAGGTLELDRYWRSLGSCFLLRFPIHLG